MRLEHFGQLPRNVTPLFGTPHLPQYVRSSPSSLSKTRCSLRRIARPMRAADTHRKPFCAMAALIALRRCGRHVKSRKYRPRYTALSSCNIMSKNKK
tara:strand:- start:5916 stop:6206 length:291 start_codon:yes stop_codon:yes gene_type:complete